MNYSGFFVERVTTRFASLGVERRIDREVVDRALFMGESLRAELFDAVSDIVDDVAGPPP